jgi:hypothetical protein
MTIDGIARTSRKIPTGAISGFVPNVMDASDPEKISESVEESETGLPISLDTAGKAFERACAGVITI